MALFDVPGWSVPTDAKPAATANAKKRKRPSGGDKLQAAEINLEKLMKQLDNPGQESKRKKKDSRTNHAGGKSNEREAAEGRKKQRREPRFKQAVSRDLKAVPAQDNKKAKKHQGAQRAKQQPSHDRAVPTHNSSVGSSSKTSPPKDENLTSLQSHMKSSLDGARFRWINETLYKSDSSTAHEMIQQDPDVFEEYHAGFRRQVTSWPSNPVVHFVSVLSTRPKGTVVVDLGCGDAQLARELVSKGLVVLSYDLISTNSFVIEADICSKLPLPGDEESNDSSHVVDIVVCSLSLMSTNWLNCIREARRVLKPSGDLKIAEVTSRFTDVEQFITVICSIGFKLQKKDDENSHFTLFDFKKIERSELSETDWGEIASNHGVLQPCEYKRR